MDSSFYVYLTSDSNEVLHQDNKPHQFRVTLDREVILREEEQWEVGLVEMTYSNIIPLFTRNESFYVYHNPRTHYQRSNNFSFKLDKTTYPASIWEEFESREAAQAFIDEQEKKSQRRVQDFYWHVRNEFTIKYDAALNRFTFTTKYKNKYRQIFLPYIYLLAMGFKAPTPLNDPKIMGFNWMTVVDKRVYNEIYVAPLPPPSDVIQFDPEIPLGARKIKVDDWGIIEYVTVKMPSGYFDSLDSVLKMINQRAVETMQTTKYLKLYYKDMDMFIHVESSNRILLQVPPTCHVIFKEGMEKILGFAKKDYERTTLAENAPSMHARTYSLLVYCNIIDPQYVGNEKLQLIRTIPLVPAKIGEDISITFENVYYFPLNTNTLHSIEVILYSDNAKSQVEIGGKTMLLLNFRRRL